MLTYTASVWACTEGVCASVVGVWASSMGARAYVGLDKAIHSHWLIDAAIDPGVK